MIVRTDSFMSQSAESAAANEKNTINMKTAKSSIPGTYILGAP